MELKDLLFWGLVVLFSGSLYLSGTLLKDLEKFKLTDIQKWVAMVVFVLSIIYLGYFAYDTLFKDLFITPCCAQPPAFS